MSSRSITVRWLAFNAVGAAGVLVHIGTLAVLVRLLDVHFLVATALAVEAAVLHNFAWHQRWTWRDRPAGTPRAAWRRLARFHMLNGTISLGGNLLLMTVLTGGLGIDPLPAGAAAILACSIVNFAASESLVFVAGVPVLALCLAAGVPARAAAAQDPAAVAAWNAYEATVDARYRVESASGPVFFIQDDPASESRGAWRTAVLAGEVTTRELDPPDAPDARIHHWAGAVFVPNTTVSAVVERLKAQAGRESEFYDDVIASRLLSRQGDRLRVFMKLRRTTVITATFNTEHEVEYRILGDRRASSRSVSTSIAELVDAGTPQERVRPPGDDRGFLWRLNAYWRFEEAAGGVIVECESLSLSRTVPALLSPIAGPIIGRVARESLERTLQGLRAALTAG